MAAPSLAALDAASRRSLPRYPINIALDVIALQSGIPNNMPGRCVDLSEAGLGAVVVDDPDLGEIIATRSMVYLALSYDHRLVDGADAARFLTTVKNRLEEGAFEAELGL